MNSSMSHMVTTKPLYQMWIGRNKFFCQGKYYAGPGYMRIILISVCIVVYYLAFFMFINNGFKSTEMIIYALILIVLFANTIVFCIKATFKDPGVLPMNLYNINLRGIKMWWMDENVNKYYVNKGRLLKLKFCSTCMIIRPLGTSHCGICNACMERFDHHCPWLGNCIARNNYKDFFIFLFNFNLGCILTLILNVIQISHTTECASYLEDNNSFQISNTTNHTSTNNSNIPKNNIVDHIFSDYITHKCPYPVVINSTFTFYPNVIEDYSHTVNSLVSTQYTSIAFTILITLVLGFILTLFIFHLYFTTVNITTYIKTKLYHINKIYTNPFDRGICKNCKYIFCLKKRKRMDFSVIINFNPYGYDSSSLNVVNQSNNENIIEALNKNDKRTISAEMSNKLVTLNSTDVVKLRVSNAKLKRKSEFSNSSSANIKINGDAYKNNEVRYERSEVTEKEVDFINEEDEDNNGTPYNDYNLRVKSMKYPNDSENRNDIAPNDINEAVTNIGDHDISNPSLPEDKINRILMGKYHTVKQKTDLRFDKMCHHGSGSEKLINK